MGFLIVDGLAGLDPDGTFRQWIEDNGAKYGKQPSGYVARTGSSRPRKVEWTPLQLRALWLDSDLGLDGAIAAGLLWQRPQPDWGAGEQRRARNDKYQGRLQFAGPWTVAAFEWNHAF